MTEDEWLQCVDPWPMIQWLLSLTTWANTDRLRLWPEVVEDYWCAKAGRNREKGTFSYSPDGSSPMAQESRVMECARIHNLKDDKPWIADLLRDNVGYPHRYLRCSRSWRTADVVRLAESIYNDRPRGVPCEFCKGTGQRTGVKYWEADRCQFCNKRLVRRTDIREQRRWCPQCMATPRVFAHEHCGICRGRGHITANLLCNQSLAILADALEEAGCTSPEILSHLRRPALPHATGCWVMYLIRGKD